MSVRPHSDAESYFTAWAEQFSVPTVLLCLDGRILWVNGAAERMLSEGVLFARQGGQMICVDKAQAHGFQNFLTSLGGTPDAWVATKADDSHVVVRGEALRPNGEAPAAALMIYPTDSSDRYVWGDLRKVFNLTKSELVVVKLLVNGDPADEIAEQLSVSVETVRTHIRRLYSKLGVSNRERLFGIISQFRVG